jgi:hypothetical protein
MNRINTTPVRDISKQRDGLFVYNVAGVTATVSFSHQALQW